MVSRTLPVVRSLAALALLSAAGCSLITPVPRSCTNGTPCAGLNRRYGIAEGSCEQWFCDFEPGAQGRCTYGAIDADGDGYSACAGEVRDCADVAPLPGELMSATAAVSPLADEDACNAVDDDCDGVIDERPSLAASVLSESDVDAIHDAEVAATASGPVWAATTRSRDAEGNDLFLAGLHRLSLTETGARREALSWSWAEPEANTPPPTYLPGTPDPRPGEPPGWVLTTFGNFADVAIADGGVGELLVAGIPSDAELCIEGRLRVGLVAGGERSVRVLGGPPNTLAQDDHPRSTIALMVDPIERDVAGTPRFCTGEQGASRVALASSPETTPPLALVSYAAEPARESRSCGGPAVPLRVMGLVIEEDTDGDGGRFRWVSGLQAPGADEGVSTRIESIELGQIVGSAPAAMAMTEDGIAYVAFPEASAVVLVRIDPPADPTPYDPTADPESRYTGLSGSGMPVMADPVVLHRFPAASADRVSMALGIDDHALAITWQEGCGEGGVGRILAATFGLEGVGPSEPAVIVEAGRRPAVVAVPRLFRADWPVEAAGGARSVRESGFLVGWIDGSDGHAVGFSPLLETGGVLTAQIGVSLPDTELRVIDAIEPVSDARDAAMVMARNGALLGARWSCSSP